jgi:CDP-diacylglycerol--glycerol-3-phosphate 3-phosphatidyltransferase
VTLPNWITFGRILLIPVFAGLMMYSTSDTHPGEDALRLRHAAAIVFLVAAITDALDGFIARRFNLKSKLGAVLDPIADKGLLITALIVLGSPRLEPEWRIPLWFLIVAFSRDLMLLGGVVALHLLNLKFEARPNWPGKTTTALQMALIVAALFRIPYPPLPWLLWAAALTTALSLVLYVTDGVRQLNASGHARS